MIPERHHALSQPFRSECRELLAIVFDMMVTDSGQIEWLFDRIEGAPDGRAPERGIQGWQGWA